MAKLRCNDCIYLKEDFCSKLNEALPNRLAKLFFGGAESILAGTVAYTSECRVEMEQKREPQLRVFISENQSEEEILEDSNLALDNSDW